MKRCIIHRLTAFCIFSKAENPSVPIFISRGFKAIREGLSTFMAFANIQLEKNRVLANSSSQRTIDEDPLLSIRRLEQN